MVNRMCRMPAQLFELGNKRNDGPVASQGGLVEPVTWQLAMHMGSGVMQASDTLDDRSERSGCGDPGPLPPPIDTLARSIATLEPHRNGFTTMSVLMNSQARARLNRSQ